MRLVPCRLLDAARNALPFSVLVGKTFMQHQGLLLAGAVAYYMLLSILPLLILLVLAVSQFLPEQQLISTLDRYLELVAPGHAAPLMEELRTFLEHSEVTGLVLLATLIFSSSLAFSVLERSFATIFHHRVRSHARSWIASALIPYAFILVLGAGLMLVTVAASALEALGAREFAVLGHSHSLHATSGALLYAIGFAGEILLLSAIYLVMPAGTLSWRLALLGGVVAGILWEVMRRVLTWFFATLSNAGVLYGSFATAISLLLSFEIAAIVLLLGAQLIAVYERRPGAAADDRPE